jgi:alpha-tubulin suppressor-like RCC1 family protein
VLEKCLFKRPTQVSFKHCLERDQTSSQSQLGSANRKKTNEESSGIAVAQIDDIKMGEYFTVVLSTRGYVYVWGMNDKGQLGIGQDVA